LETADLQCWIAPRDIPPGHSWATAIVDGINACSVLVLLLTERSAGSPEVHREVELASNGRKQMLTVRLDPRAQLSGPLAYFLASIQWIEATGRPLGRHLDPLLAAVEGCLGRPAVQPKKSGPRRRGRDEDDGRGALDLDILLRRGQRER
jgi:hypothetical protein